MDVFAKEIQDIVQRSCEASLDFHERRIIENEKYLKNLMRGKYRYEENFSAINCTSGEKQKRRYGKFKIFSIKKITTLN